MTQKTCWQVVGKLDLVYDYNNKYNLPLNTFQQC